MAKTPKKNYRSRPIQRQSMGHRKNRLHCLAEHVVGGGSQTIGMHIPGLHDLQGL